MEFKVISQDSGVDAESDRDPRSRIDKMVSENEVFLFMKGTPDSPQCGFSYKVVDILKAWNVPYKSFNVLSDEGIRQGVKDYANWQTIPQLYINKEFVGGSDVVEEMSNNGELGEMFTKAFPDMEINSPPPAAEVIEITSIEASDILKEKPQIRLLDVRSPDERQTACIKNSELLDQKMVEDILDSWDRDSEIMFVCHVGQRSRQAAQYFASQGFQKVYNISDGIKGWSSTVDPSVPQY